MEMSFCHLGFARPVVLLPKAQMLVTTVFPEFAGRARGCWRMGGEERQADGAEMGGRLERKPPVRGSVILCSGYCFV